MEDCLYDLFKSMDFHSLDEACSDMEGMRFSDLVWNILKEGPSFLFSRESLNQLVDFLFGELSGLKSVLLQVIMIACVFTFGNRFLEGGRIRSSKISFLMVYGLVLILILKPMSRVSYLVEEGLSELIRFLTMFLPVFETGLVMTGKILSSSVFSQGAIFSIYLMEWVVGKWILPLVRVFLYVQLLNHVLEEEKLGHLCDLIEKFISYLLKLGLGIVLGWNCIQSILTPAKDKLEAQVLTNGLEAVPGVGGSVESAKEIMVGAGLVLKNTIGVAGLVMITGILVFPILKIWVVNFSYRILSALMEPFSDKRIVNLVDGVGRTIGLYLKCLWYVMLLFWLLLAMVCLVTSG